MFDIYSEITKRMIQEMEQGIIPWQKPWMASGSAISHNTGKPYSLLKGCNSFPEPYAAYTLNLVFTTVMLGFRTSAV